MSGEFTAFPSISRLSRDMVVTEKLDGTNAQVSIEELVPVDDPVGVYPRPMEWAVARVVTNAGDFVVRAGSRNRWITPEADNFGFARWVSENAEDLTRLGPGQHFGEWWGLGIQRGYGLTEKRFSLFNTHRWSDPAVRPACCHVVPVLLAHSFDTKAVDYTLETLKLYGSAAAPGFMKPEGIVIYHTVSKTLFKKTLDGDGHKGAKS